MWWPQLVELTTDLAPIQLPAAADCLKFPKGSTEDVPNLDPIYTFHISGKVVYNPVAIILRFWMMLIEPCF